MVNRLRRLMRARWVLPALFVIVAILISLGGWVLVTNYKDLAPQYRLAAARAALTVASGLILGGALKFVLDSHLDAQAERQRESARRHDQLTGLRTVHDQVESARLLIPANRSATTYGELMRELIAAQVTLLDVRRSLATEPRGRSNRWNKSTAEEFGDMVGYLQALAHEYRKGFKDASDAERFDVELTVQEYRRIAAEDLRGAGVGGGAAVEPARAGPRGTVVPKSSDRAWAFLQDPKIFPVLHDFCAGGESYRSEFIEPYHAVVRRLLIDPIAAGRPVDPREEDDEFSKHTHDASAEIARRCAERAAAAGEPGAAKTKAAPEEVGSRSTPASAAPAAEPAEPGEPGEPAVRPAPRGR